ncbi:hypothetical protein [Balneatrix alpica]|uniref:Glycerate kinase n=1 Tax=Balneatrix alpica TaxID=75684 RepID=A0ABV5ZG01_9GAMM|nr:hypothetical protein [Balneatrix alpica]
MTATCVWPAEFLALSEQQRHQATEATLQAFSRTLASLQLDIGLSRVLESVYVPLAAWLAQRQQQLGRPMIVGINGAQGAGKSTLSNLLEIILTQGLAKRVVNFSIDDLYKTRKERQDLAEQVHPLLLTRGVPGTHDVELGLDLLDSLVHAKPGQATKIPVFDKSIDDRCEPLFWQEWEGSADLILFEGWCVGASAQPEQALQQPVNSLEAEEDSQGIWRHYVNQQLQGRYAQLFAKLDTLVMLRVPDMESVYRWRTQQEQKLAERVRMVGSHHATEGLRIMDEAQIRRFIMHYERITRYQLEEMPQRAEVTLHLNAFHQIAQIDLRPL